MNSNEQIEATDFMNKVERGRRIVSEMSDVRAFEVPEIAAIASFAVWQSNSDLDSNIRIQSIRMAIEAAYKFGQMHPIEALKELLRAAAYVLTEKDSDLAIARNKAAGIIYKATNSL